jgi:SAM-dependent methyltransferase
LNCRCQQWLIIAVTLFSTIELTLHKDKGMWANGDSYDSYVGRWSRLVAHQFLGWLDIPSGVQWLDVGCGTGALSQTILDNSSPHPVLGIDSSEEYIAFARNQIQDPRAAFQLGYAQALPVEPAAYDVVVSGLVLNFVPQPTQPLCEMIRAVRKGGTVAAYVWDYAGQMQPIRNFWDAAVALDAAACTLDVAFGRKTSCPARTYSCKTPHCPKWVYSSCRSCVGCACRACVRRRARYKRTIWMMAIGVYLSIVCLLVSVLNFSSYKSA